MKVAFLVTALDYGGAETQVYLLASTLRQRGWDVVVISMIPPRAYARELEEKGVGVLHLGMKKGIPDPRAILKLASILKKEKPVVVHAHMVHANLLARVTRLVVPIPVLICTAHSTIEGGARREFAYRLTDFLCDLTTQVSQRGLERYVQRGIVPPSKIRFVPNGVDTERFRANPEVRKRVRDALGIEQRFVWLAVGRLEEAKDYPTLIKAFSLLAPSFPEALLLIVGPGPLRGSLETIVKEKGLEQKVRFLGVRKDIPDLMNAADAFVLSSVWEGFPMALLEATASGLPIVATDVGDNRDIVGEGGIIVQPQDPETLAAAMGDLMRLSDEERRKMALSARARVERLYSLERVVDLWERIYREFLRIE